MADDVVVCVADCDALVRLGVGYWGFEKGEFRALFISTSGAFEYCVRCISKFKYISRLRVLSSS